MNLRALTLSLALSLLSSVAIAAASYQPQNLPMVDGTVGALASDGTYAYIGGSFNHLAYAQGNFVIWDSVAGAAVSPIARVEGGAVNAVAADGSGGWYLGGDFTTVNGLAWPRLAHLAADGSLDSSFLPPTNGYGTYNALALINGQLYVGGNFSVYTPGGYLYDLIRVDAASGAVDQAFNPMVNGNVYAVTGNAGSLWVGGYFYSVSNTVLGGVAKLNLPSGSLDSAFAVSFTSYPQVNSLAFDGSSLLVGGSFSHVSGGAYANALRVDAASGVLDLAFTPRPDGWVYDIRPDGAGGAFLTGGFYSIHGSSCYFLARVDPAGSLLPGFGNANYAVLQGSGRCLAPRGGDLWVGGGFTGANGLPQRGVGLFNGAGQSVALGAGTFGPVNALAWQGNRLGVAGTPKAMGGTVRRNLARLKLDTLALDPSFDPSPDGAVTAMAVDGQRLYLGGDFNFLSTTAASRLAFLDPSYPQPVPLQISLTAAPRCMAVDPSNHSLIVGGSFLATAWYFSTSNLAVFSGAWPFYFPGPNGSVESILATPGAVYLGGNFTQLNGIATRGVAKLSSDLYGNLYPDSSFSTSVQGTVYAMGLGNLGLEIAGSFNAVSGQSRAAVARLNSSSGALDLAYAPVVSTYTYYSVKCLAKAGGERYFGGDFYNAGPNNQSHFVKLKADNGFEYPFPTANSSVNRMIYEPVHGLLFLAGTFDSISGVNAVGLAALAVPAPSAEPTLSPTPVPVDAFDASPNGRDIAGPVPARRGQPWCLNFGSRPAGGEMEAFNSAGERVLSFGFAGGYHQCADTSALSPGLYLLRLRVRGMDGKERQRTQKAVILP